MTFYKFLMFFIVFCVFESVASNLRANDDEYRSYYQMITNYQARLQYCFNYAARTYGINVWLLWGIAKVESGFNPYAVNRNKDGSYDLGMMQINSRWFNHLKEVGLISDEKDLYDPCKAVVAGAYILKQCIDDYGYTWEAVGCYHSRNKVRRKRYAMKVYRVIVNEMNKANQDGS